MINPIQPAIYKLGYDKDSGYYLTPYKQSFTVEGKSYGSMNKHVDLFWGSYLRKSHSMGVMLTGAAGSGKTRMAEMLSNIALRHNMFVVMITEIPIKLELISYIDSLCNAVIMFDEFSKNVNMSMQGKMLTMFSAIGPAKKLFIITENELRSVSQFIRTRPGRIRYALDFSRVEIDVVEECCSDYGVCGEFKETLLKLHSKAPKMAFDHLQTIVSEHVAMPDMSLDELLEILNLSDLLPIEEWVVTSILENATGTTYKEAYGGGTYSKDRLTNPYASIRICVESEGEVPKAATLILTLSKLADVDKDDQYTYVVDGFTVVLSPAV